MVSYSNILIIQTAFIGDAILASSVAEKMHIRFPEARISMLVREGNEGIYEQHPYLHETLVWRKKKGKLKNLFALIRQVRARNFDCVINCHRYFSSGLITSLSKAKHTAGFKENPLSFLFNTTGRHTIGDGTHETERYNRLISDMAPGPPSPPRLYPPEQCMTKIRPYIGKTFVCVAPASVWNTKQLPVQKWVALCDSMPHQLYIYLLGSAGDSKLCEIIAEKTTHNRVQSLAGKLSLLESCELMRHATRNYVNDSAPLHLASAVNAPVTAFFCSTVPAFGFGPLSDDSEIMGVDDLPCRPCGIRGYAACPLKHFKCGNDMPLPMPPAA